MGREGGPEWECGIVGDRGPRGAAPAPRAGGCRVPGITDGLGILTRVMVPGEIQYMEKMRIGILGRNVKRRVNIGVIFEVKTWFKS